MRAELGMKLLEDTAGAISNCKCTLLLWRCLIVYIRKFNFCRVRFMVTTTLVISLSVIFLWGAAGVSYAEPERYDFPREAPAISIQPARPVFSNLSAEEMAALREAYRATEIKRGSIAAFIRRHNRGITQEQAYNYATLIKQACEQFGQDPFIIAALVIAESTARSNVVSRGGDYGLMQVRWRVHQRRIQNRYPHITTAQDILDPRYNLLIGTEIFTAYRAMMGQDIRRTLVRYSGGSNRLADRVFALASQLERLHQERLNNII